MRLHLSLPATKLEESARFYEVLLGEAPTRSFAGYTHFLTSSVNLALTAANEALDSSGGHYGLEVETAGEVSAAASRLARAGFATRSENETRCCHSLQTKVWAEDPDGRRWEVFQVLARDMMMPVPDDGSACC
jgi:catechol 2,3-dioxygenase-like lactoylglutathione lyase family enzyme